MGLVHAPIAAVRGRVFNRGGHGERGGLFGGHSSPSESSAPSAVSFFKRNLLTAVTLLWLLVAGWISGRDYFWRWAQSPDVRGAYQVNLMTALDYLAVQDTPPPIVMSTVYPGPAHDASIALVIRPHAAEDLRWVDARSALLWPGGQAAHALIPTATPLHPALARFLQPLATQHLRPDDLDPAFTLYALAPPDAPMGTAVADFGGAVQLLQAEWLTGTVMGGETAVILTTWQVTNPARIGPPVPPTFTPDTVFFTQVLTPEGTVLAQQDALDAPAWNWQAGDVFVQIHQLPIPPDTPPGEYRAIVGVYGRSSLERVPTTTGETFTDGPPLIVTPPN
jgi:hypothetical protein